MIQTNINRIWFSQRTELIEMLNLIFFDSSVLPFSFIESSENLSSQHAERTSSAQSSAEPSRGSNAQQQMHALTQKSSMDLQMSTALHGKAHLTYSSYAAC